MSHAAEDDQLWEGMHTIFHRACASGNVKVCNALLGSILIPHRSRPACGIEVGRWREYEEVHATTPRHVEVAAQR